MVTGGPELLGEGKYVDNTTVGAGAMKLIREAAVGAALLLAWSSSFGAAATNQTSPTTFDIRIESKPLAEALNELASQTGLQVIFRDEVAASNRIAPQTIGTLTPEAALGRLLAGSGLSYEFVNARTVAIRSVVSAVPDSTVGSQATRPLMRLANLVLADAPATEDVQQTRAAANAQGSDNNKRLPGGLEEVMVTATKRREERVQDVPMSIAVISNQNIERRGVIGMEDYLRSIAGVNQIDRGPQDNAIVIRGITTSPQFENINSGTTVATYFDETPITGAAGRGTGGIDVRPVDIERIEILRGPQGTAYGSASLGGTMRIIPVKPKLDGFGAKLTAAYSETSGYGSENWMGQGVLNIPVITDKVAVRAVGYRYDESGFYRNVAGSDPATIAWAERFGLGDYVRGHVEDNRGRIVSTGGRLAALWQATDKLNLSLNFLTQKIEQDGSPLAMVGKFEQARVPIAPQARGRGGAGEINDTEMDLLNAVLNYDFGWAALTSAVSWIDSGSVYANGPGLVSPFYALLGPSSTSAQSDFQSFTAEVRLASQFDGRFQFLGGLFYEDVEEDYFQPTGQWPGPPATNPYRTDPIFQSSVTRGLDQRAIFGEVSYDLTEKLTATVGGRYFEYEKDQSIIFEGGFIRVPIGTGIPQVLENSEDGSTFKANLSYKPMQDSLLYASWSEGFRLGRPDTGLSQLSTLCDRDGDGVVDGTGISIESTTRISSDFLEQYEIGGKLTLFDRRMLVDVAVYYIDWEGLPIRTIAPSCNAAYTANVGGATSTGVEFQASLLVGGGLRLDFGAGYTNAELSEDAPGLAPPAFEGDRLPGSPKVSANLSAQYDFDLAGYNAFVRADSFYTGEFYGDLRETSGLRAGDYIKIDARSGVEIRKLSLELFVRNLTNEDSFTWRDVTGGTNPFLGHRLRPRTVGIQLSYSFE